MTLRIVLDTDVLVAAVRSPTGASRIVVDAIYGRRVEAAATVGLMLEYEAVLKRPEHLRAANLERADVDTMLGVLADRLVPVHPDFSWRPQPRDPADELVLEAAVNGSASAIVTFNVRHFRPAAARFGKAVMRPAELVRGWRG